MVANPARVAGDLLGRLQLIPGWRAFTQNVAPLSALASTPGWEDSDGRKTQPGAKAIGLAQWGSAMTVAAVVTDAVRGAPWPDPGIDPSGFLWLTWRIGDSAELALELHADMNRQTYKWTSMRDGTPRSHSSESLGDVVEALRAVMVGASAPPAKS